MNIQNKDNQCFKYAVMAGATSTEDPTKEYYEKFLGLENDHINA